MMWEPWPPTESCCTKDVLVHHETIYNENELSKYDLMDDLEWDFIRPVIKGEEVRLEFYKRVKDPQAFELAKLKYERDSKAYKEHLENELKEKENKLNYLKRKYKVTE